MKDYLGKIEKEMMSSGYLEKSLKRAVIEITEVNIQLMQVSGRYFIYLLCNKDEIIYAGRTMNLYARLISHKMYKKFTDVIIIEYSSDNILFMEKQIVKLIKPTLNKCWVTYGL